ncbi:hypothetical protein ACHAQA_008124 [Verticillium albo-atrum]
MAAPLDDILPEADRLRGQENWSTWVTRMVPILHHHDLDLITSVKEPCAVLMDIINDQAMDLLRRNCSPHILNGARCSNAWILWKRLDYRFSRHPSDIALDTQDSRTMLRNDVEEFNEAFNLRIRQIYGYHCREPHGTQGSRVRTLYYDTVGEVYDYWVRRMKEKENRGYPYSMDDIQEKLVKFTQHMERFDDNDSGRYGTLDDVSSAGILTPATESEYDSDEEETEEEGSSGEETSEDDSSAEDTFKEEELEGDPFKSRPWDEDAVERQGQSEREDDPEKAASDKALEAVPQHQKRKVTKARNKKSVPSNRVFTLPEVLIMGIILLLTCSWLSAPAQPQVLDLLKRHLTSHANARTRATAPSNSVSDTPTRVTKACRTCASNHLRCTETKPCTRCVEKGLNCLWFDPLDDEEDEDSLDEGNTTTQSEAVASADTVMADEDSSIPPIDSGLDTTDDHNVSTHYDPHIVHPTRLLPTVSSEPFTPVRPFMPLQGHVPNTGFDVNFFFSDFPDLRLLSGSWATPALLSPALEATTELDDMDLQFLDTYNTTVPFELGGLSEADTSSTRYQPDMQDPNLSHSNRIRAEAFRNFQWRFRPSANDHAGAEEHNLSLPEANDNTSPESRLSVNLRITCARLKVSTRDRNLSKTISSFPSVELLDTLIQYYLGSSLARSDAFIHTPTFDPNTKRPELVAAMAAAGAVLTLDPALAKLGYAIQESVRASIPEMLAQGFLITLEVAMWSGHSRKVEIAESFLQPLVTMLRRDNKFRRSRYPEATLDPTADDAALDKAWQTWIEMESCKRLAFRVMFHDTNSSMSLFVNPIISYAETQLPLPASSQLWMASNPQQWKDAVYARASLRRLSLHDYLDDPESIAAPDVDVDKTLSREAFLSSAWSMAWEYIQMNSLQRSKPRRWNALVMTTRRDELSKLLSHFQISMDLSSPSTATLELLIRLELILLHIYTPFEDLQIFAGIEGPEQARTIYPAVLDWARGESARKAVWHAGQAIRLTRHLPSSTIRGFTAIMVYHASLAFWVYGLASDKLDSREQWTETPGSSSSTQVWLDEPDSLPVQRFLQLGSGFPCIHGMSDEGAVVGVPISSPDRIMETVLGVLRENFEGTARPLLVEKLVQLMAGLQRSSRSTGEAEL